MVGQSFSDELRTIYLEEKNPVTGWHTLAECTSAFCRLTREGKLGEAELGKLLRHLQSECMEWHRVIPTASLDAITIRLLRTHPLRAMDALHLASACLVFGSGTHHAKFLTLDKTQALAAAREGFSVPYGIS